jgi:hypothetical protein
MMEGEIQMRPLLTACSPDSPVLTLCLDHQKLGIQLVGHCSRVGYVLSNASERSPITAEVKAEPWSSAEGEVSRLQRMWADGAYRGCLIHWARRSRKCLLENVSRLAEATGFVLLKWHWIVTRRLGVESLPPPTACFPTNSAFSPRSSPPR